ncbi:unnamed protein product, partial [Brenthis ino]
MSDRERDRSASRRGSRSPSHERRSDRDRSDSRRRERSPDENTRLRLEMRTMIARLSALENKSRATSIPARSSEHMAGSSVRDVLVSENVQDRSPSRRRQTRLLGRNISRSPDRTVSRSVRRPLSPRCRSRSPNKYTTSRSRDHVLPTREVSQRRRSRSRSPRRGSEVDASMHSTITDRIVDVINSINNAGRFSQHFYISNFDPDLHNIDDWCAEPVNNSKSSMSRSVPYNRTKDKQSFDVARRRSSDIKCYLCGQLGHRQASCTKRPRVDRGSSSSAATSNSATPKPAFVPTRYEPCSFCKKPGLLCFVCVLGHCLGVAQTCGPGAVYTQGHATSWPLTSRDAEDEESTAPSVTQPYNVDVPGDASEPQPSTSGTQIHGEEPAASPTFTSSDDSTEPSMPMLETNLQS